MPLHRRASYATARSTPRVVRSHATRIIASRALSCPPTPSPPAPDAAALQRPARCSTPTPASGTLGDR
ncbi:hypothetical protein U9M48_011146 [Paspalum notatum var. saurae]|uniref:Uncharacterized protein n=1 Tax=Paspalum notatum var. saurae TaxID=547442 RepID=A0AAQ3SWL5_PASNO